MTVYLSLSLSGYTAFPSVFLFCICRPKYESCFLAETNVIVQSPLPVVDTYERRETGWLAFVLISSTVSVMSTSRPTTTSSSVDRLGRPIRTVSAPLRTAPAVVLLSSPWVSSVSILPLFLAVFCHSVCIDCQCSSSSYFYEVSSH